MIIFVLIMFIVALIWIEVRLWIINVHLRQKLVNIQDHLQSIFVQNSCMKSSIDLLFKELNIKRKYVSETPPTLKFLFDKNN